MAKNKKPRSYKKELKPDIKGKEIVTTTADHNINDQNINSSIEEYDSSQMEEDAVVLTCKDHTIIVGIAVTFTIILYLCSFLV